MNIGYQGQKSCYSYQVVKKYLSDNIKTNGYNNFELVFDALENREIDFAVLPIENSIGGSIFVNFDLFYKYDVNIHCEFHHNINHSLYSLNNNIHMIENVISHPQAIQQCINNIKKHNLTPNDFWDTTGSLQEIKDSNNTTMACIGPPNLGEEFGLNELIKDFNDQERNITRFYLISLKSRELIYHELIKNKIEEVNYKFSGYIIAKDKIGILNDYLFKFKTHNYNLTKIESRPYLGQDREIFSYIFYLEGIIPNNLLNLKNDVLKNIPSFNQFGIFPLLEQSNKEIKQKKHNLRVAIIGFGRFGQFIGNQMVHYGFDVYATSRTDYTELAKELGIIFLDKESFQSLSLEQGFDIVILATSILSFEQVLKSYPIEVWNNKLVVDVLSVKVYPYKILKKYLKNCNILLTHPMFGPDSAKSFGHANCWQNKNFVYWKDLVNEKQNLMINIFLDFWENQGCNMIEMIPEKHDDLTANSQFLTHFIGRTLELLDCKNTQVDTDGYKSLVTIKNHSVNDSWDLFYALAKYNPSSIDTINKLKYQINKLENQILYPEGKAIKQSETGKMFSKILDLKSQGKDIINSAIGIPSWYPTLPYSSYYSTAKGNLDLINKLVEYYHEKHRLDINKDNLLISVGAKPALYLSLKLLTNIGTTWLIPKPYWTSYPDMVELVNGSSIFIEASVENNWSLDLTEIEDKFKNNMVNGIILCHPNNPTGLAYNDNFIEKLILLAKKYNKYLILDEVYLPLTDKTTSYSIANNHNFDKIIIVSSFSKYWAVPGWRVSWVLSNPKIISKLVKLQSSIFTCAPTASQEVCFKLLDDNFIPDLSILKEAGDELSKLFKSKGWLIPTNPDLSMYLFPVNEKINIDELVDKLLKDGLGVISGEPFGYNQAIRLTLPNNYQDLNKIKNILLNIL